LVNNPKITTFLFFLVWEEEQTKFDPSVDLSLLLSFDLLLDSDFGFLISRRKKRLEFWKKSFFFHVHVIFYYLSI
jgi:hypothetical protein